MVEATEREAIVSGEPVWEGSLKVWYCLPRLEGTRQKECTSPKKCFFNNIGVDVGQRGVNTDDLCWVLITVLLVPDRSD